jgi:hypothetical protein
MLAADVVISALAEERDCEIVSVEVNAPVNFTHLDSD